MKQEISKTAKDDFLAYSAKFLKQFEVQFCDYFISLCEHYNCTISKDDAMTIALAIYKNVFKCGLNVDGLREDILVKMRQDGVMVGFLISRSMFYLIENYIDFAKEKNVSPEIEMLISCVGRFISSLEGEVTYKVSSCVVDFDFNTKDSMVFNNNIIDSFRKIKDESGSVEFLNLYQGVPIRNQAKIVKIDGDKISFRVDKLQEIAMKLDGNAFMIKNDYLSKHVKADIVYSNFLTNTVILNNFVYLLNMPALEREFTRVNPDIVANVYLRQFGDIQTTGRLYDLSIGGLGVVSSENNGIFIGARVKIDFELNESSNKVEVDGEVINIIEYKGAYRYCMRIFPQKEMSMKILQYIKQREKEIIDNLKDELQGYII